MPITQITPNPRVGRPRLPEDEKKSRVSLTLSKNTLAGIDNTRAQIPRSTFIESVLQIQNRQSIDAREFIRRNGAVYTPPTLADFVAGKAIDFLLGRHNGTSLGRAGGDPIQKLRIIDPACGSGELLNAAWNHLKSGIARSGSRGMGRTRIDPRDILCGIEIEQRAAAGAAFRLESLATAAGFINNRPSRILNMNGLFPFNAPSSAAGWERVRKHFSVIDGFDVVIANPPWGADVSGYRGKLDQKEFSLFQGQYDTSDLFIETALSILRPKGFLAFIIPDSLFNLERRHLRKLLLDKTHIRFVARLGEKFFEDINRACAVIICQKCAPKPGARVKCLRLTPEARKNILGGVSTFGQEEQRLLHEIPQTRFARNFNYAFDIDLNVAEERILDRIGGGDTCFGTYLESTRGVELSKSGNVCQCQQCRMWIPMPAMPQTRCMHCGTALVDIAEDAVSIVREKRMNRAVPFIVGESVGRYNLKQSLWILQNFEGINYKDRSIYRGPKLLVRKTGVGISAAIDYTNAYTNQVVYIFRRRQEDSACGIPLEFFLGVLNSRAIYYFLTKRHGETEWRSHPYVTQSQILALPLPSKDVLMRKSDTIRRITSLLLPHTRRGVELPAQTDAAVERLVAKLFGLKKKEYESIYATLDSVQELLPVRKLKRVGLADIF